MDTTSLDVYIQSEVVIFIPNAFTPNDDQHNDVFLPQGIGISTEEYLLLIFDRWGTKVFETDLLDEGWKGDIRRRPVKATTGVYTYKITFRDIFKREREYFGHVFLLR